MPCDYRNELLRFGERSAVREEEAKGAPTDNVLNETWYERTLGGVDTKDKKEQISFLSSLSFVSFVSFFCRNQIIVLRIMQSDIHRDSPDVRKSNLLQCLDHLAHRKHPAVQVKVLGLFGFEFSEEVLIDDVQIITGEESSGDRFDVRRANAEMSSGFQHSMEFPEDMQIVGFPKMLQCSGGENFLDDAGIDGEAFPNIEDKVDLGEGNDVHVQKLPWLQGVTPSADIQLRVPEAFFLPFFRAFAALSPRAAVLRPSIEEPEAADEFIVAVEEACHAEE